MESTKVYEESPGVTSSKRVAGLALCAAGVSIMLAVGVLALCRREAMANAGSAIEAGKWLALAGAGLLGITTFQPKAS